MLDAGCLMALQKVKHVGCSMKCFVHVQIFHPKSNIRKFIKIIEQKSQDSTSGIHL